LKNIETFPHKYAAVTHSRDWN